MRRPGPEITVHTRNTKMTRRCNHSRLRRYSVEAPGIENESGRTLCTISQRKGTVRHDGVSGSVSSHAPKFADGGGVGTESSWPQQPEYELRDVVEPALARALVLAAEAQRWDVVLQIASELQARRRRSGQRAVEQSVPVVSGRRVRARRP
jgi:hypothetical protein